MRPVNKSKSDQPTDGKTFSAGAPLLVSQLASATGGLSSEIPQGGMASVLHGEGRGFKSLTVQTPFTHVPLSRGKFALIDLADYDRVGAFKWRLGSHGYACRNVTVNGKSVAILLHRFILGATNGQWVDHKDRNPLNCTKANLRICTSSQNKANKPKRPDSGNAYKGIRPYRGRWDAAITVNGKRLWLGSYDTQEAAALAYNRAATLHFGEFAYLNEVPEVNP